MNSKKQPKKVSSRNIKSYLVRYHMIIFFVFISSCLIGAVMLANSVISTSSIDEAYSSSISAGSIDNATLRRIQSLHTSDNPPTASSLPPGRVNPFSE